MRAIVGAVGAGPSPVRVRRGDRDPNRGRRQVPLSWFTVGEFLAAEADEVERNTCRVCGETIRIMIYRYTGYCSGRCEAVG